MNKILVGIASTTLLVALSQIYVIVVKSQPNQLQVNITYDIVYVKSPRLATSPFADVFNPYTVSPNSDLILRHANGTEEILVDSDPIGAVADPCVSFDGRVVYYTYNTNVVKLSNVRNIPVTNFDIWKVDVASKARTQLTHGEYTPNTGVRTAPLPYGIFNMGPCPVNTSEGLKIVFTSNRNGFVPPKGYTPVTLQLFVMDLDGSNVQQIGYLNLSAALHPFQRSDGNVLFSSQEDQGLRDERGWGLWSIWPDGREWGPVVSAFQEAGAFHFAGEKSDGSIVVDDYYNYTNAGFGSFYQIPRAVNTAVAGFYPAFLEKNPDLQYTPVYGKPYATWKMPFTPTGLFVLTPFSTVLDEASGLKIPGTDPLLGARFGKVTQPSGAPDNNLLLSYSTGPVNFLPRPTSMPHPDAGIYIYEGDAIIDDPNQLQLIVNNPNFNELWPRALVPYQTIYGIQQPHEFAFLPNDGTRNAALPVGTPYGIIGTSSLYKRESFPGVCIPALTYDCINGFNSGGEPVSSNWIIQGSEGGKYSNADIYSIRIVVEEPATEPAPQDRGWFNHAQERLRILGEVPVRKFNPDGTPVLDSEGNPDTSFWAKIPADTSFTFQMLDAKGHVLTMAQTWHQVRPGEVRTNCGGCHAHSSVPLAFETTAAAKTIPMDLLAPAHDVEYKRDIEPIIQTKCISCHRNPNPPANLFFEANPDANYIYLANDKNANWGLPPLNVSFWGVPNVSRYVAVPQSLRSLLQWKIEGKRLDGWTNAQWPSGPDNGSNPFYRHLWDIDFVVGTVDHSTLLTAAQQRLVADWIALFAPINQGKYFQDETRPTLSLKVKDGQLYVGAADAYSGLNNATLTTTIDGITVNPTIIPGNRWTIPFPSGTHKVIASVKDNAGNTTTSNRDLTNALIPPPETPVDCIITAIRGGETVTVTIKQVLDCMIQ